MPSLDTGLYLISKEAPFDGHVNALNACAYLTFPNPDPQDADAIFLYFYVASYRLMGNRFERISDTLELEFNIYTNETFGCYPITFARGNRPRALMGERLGVFIPDEDCHQFFTNPPRYYCPAHLNIVDPIKNCSQSLHFSDAELKDNRMPAELDANNGHPVDIFINMELFFGRLKCT